MKIIVMLFTCLALCETANQTKQQMIAQLDDVIIALDRKILIVQKSLQEYGADMKKSIQNPKAKLLYEKLMRINRKKCMMQEERYRIEKGCSSTYNRQGKNLAKIIVAMQKVF